MKETTSAQRVVPFESAEETAASPASTSFLGPPACSSSSFLSSSSSPAPSSSSSLPSCFSSSSTGPVNLPPSFSCHHPSSSSSSSPSSSSSSSFPSYLSSSLAVSSSSSTASFDFRSSSCAPAACSPALCAGAARGEAEAAPPAAVTAEKWEEHPLFMTSMPSGEAFRKNPLLAALAAVIDEEEQLPFEAQRRRPRGGEGRRRDKEEKEGRKQGTEPKESSASHPEEVEVERTSAFSTLQGKGTAPVDGNTAAAIAEEKRSAEKRAARPTAVAAATYRNHRSSCVPYGPRQRAAGGEWGTENEGEKVPGYTLSSVANALEVETESQREAPPSMGELQICMKMWQM